LRHQTRLTVCFRHIFARCHVFAIFRFFADYFDTPFFIFAADTAFIFALRFHFRWLTGSAAARFARLSCYALTSFSAGRPRQHPEFAQPVAIEKSRLSFL